MNFKKIYEMQKSLDDAIASRNDLAFSANEKDKTNYHNMKVLALLVETAEFANEIQTFKYWKAQKNIDHEKILEEFADIIHFLGSLAYKYKCKDEIEPLIISQDINYQICLLFQTIASTINNINNYVIEEMIAMAIGVIKLLGYSEEEVIKSYLIKNQKNWDRVKNKY